MSAVRVVRNSSSGVGSLVGQDIPPMVVACGNPADPVKGAAPSESLVNSHVLSPDWACRLRSFTLDSRNALLPSHAPSSYVGDLVVHAAANALAGSLVHAGNRDRVAPVQVGLLRFKAAY